ncbi:MAG: hypothetical protein Q9174_006824, partial [Haloplaca sp. 1 TL-2023]
MLFASDTLDRYTSSSSTSTEGASTEAELHQRRLGPMKTAAIIIVLLVVSDITYRNHGYAIQHCYDSSERISAVVDNIRTHIQKAIEYIDSTPPQNATLYNAFFQGVPRVFVKGVLTRVSVGAEIWTPTHNNGQGAHLPPSITCVAP